MTALGRSDRGPADTWRTEPSFELGALTLWNLAVLGNQRSRPTAAGCERQLSGNEIADFLFVRMLVSSCKNADSRPTVVDSVFASLVGCGRSPTRGSNSP